MATSTSFFGQRRGSTRSHTYQVYRGKQVTKDRVTKVSNPQSTKQMKQRIRLTAVASFAAYLKQILDHSFQGVAYGQPSLSEFRRLNLSNATDLAQVSFPPKDVNDPGLADFQVSKGSLIPYKPVFKAGDNAFNFETNQDAIVPKVGADKAITPTADFCKAIAKTLGIEVGQQATFILQLQSGDWSKTYGDGSKDYFLSQFAISRIITDINDSECLKGWYYDDKTECITDGVMQLSVSTGDKELQLYSNGEASLPDSFSKLPSSWDLGNIAVSAWAAIVSQNVNGVYQRSQAYMNIVSENAMKTSYEDAEKTYLKDAAKSDKYLNGGTEMVIQAM